MSKAPTTSDSPIGASAPLFGLELHRPILDALPLPIWSTDAEGRCSYVNRAWLELTGRTFAEEIGEGWLDSVHLDDRRRWRAQWQSARAAEAPFEIEYRLKRANGDFGWIHHVANPIHNADDTGKRFIGYLGLCHDNTELRNAELAAREHEAQIRLLADNLPVLISYFQATDLRCLFANKTYAKAWGWDENSIIGKTVPEIIGEEGWRHIEPYVERVIRGETVSYERQIAPSNGEERTIEVNLIPHFDESGKTFAAFVLISDITKHRLAENAIRESELRLRKFSDATNEGIVFHEKGVITDCNEAAASMMILTSAQLVGRNIFEFIAPESMDSVRQNIAAGFERAYECTLVRADGSRLAAELIGKQMIFGEKTLRMTVVRDITDRRQAEARIQFLAHHDALTQLPNRLLMMDRLGLTLAAAKRHGKKVGVLFIDLDNFKTVNDSLGHHAGDALLKRVAMHIQSCLRSADVVARLGGDEFLVLVSDLTAPEDVTPVAEKLLAAISEPFSIEGQVLSVSPSIGIAIYPRDGEDANTLIKNADAAMYLAKDRGRSNFQFFTPSLNTRAFEALSMESGIRKAIKAVEFTVFYQPEVRVETRELVGIEALIRWKHPELGLLGPDRFISIAENRGLIMPIGRWVLQEACRQNKVWQDAGFPKVPMAVNLSPIHFKQPNLADDVAKILAETGLDGQYLALEITENLLMEDVNAMTRAFQGLKELGVGLVVDDFGAGYSSLSYLKRYPIDKLKIDRSFIRDVPDNHEDVGITIAMINLSKSLGMRVLAEGVETMAQLDFLISQKCDEMQGFLISRPVPPEEFEHWMRSQRAK